MSKLIVNIIDFSTGKRVPELEVEAVVKIKNDEAILAKEISNEKGICEFNLEDRMIHSYVHSDPESFVFFKVYQKNHELITDTRKSVQWFPKDPVGRITVSVKVQRTNGQHNYVTKGLLKDARTGLPLSDFFIRAFAIKDGKEELLTETATDHEGSFMFAESVIKPLLEDADSEKELMIRVYHNREEKSPILEQKEKILLDDTLHIKPILLQADIAPALELITQKLGWELPPEINAVIKEKNIRSIEELSSSGIIQQFKKHFADHEENLNKLEAHARLSVLPSTTLANEQLIKNGFDSVESVLQYSRDEFVNKTKEAVSIEQANDIYEFASAYKKEMLNGITGLRTYEMKDAQGQMINLPETDSCDCDECQNATSPTAYLTDLLNYTINHLRNNSNPVTLTWLEQRFHQPFRSLPTECAAQKKQIRQVRICIEVLRDMLPANFKSYVPLAYLEFVYRQFLEAYGTSYEEMRELRIMKDDAKKEAAALLGIPYVPGGHTYTDDLYRDIAAAPGSSNTALSEGWLEYMFGLKDTSRPPLTPLPGKGFGKFGEWRFEFYHQKWIEEDADPQTFVLGTLPLLDPDNISMSDLAHTPQNPKPGNKWQWNEADYLYERNHWAELTKASLNDYRISTNPSKTFDEMLQALAIAYTIGNVATGVMNGIAFNDLVTQRNKLDNGGDVSQWLTQKNLSLEVFTRLSDLALLESKTLPISQQEWNEFYDIVIQRAKELELNAVWKDEELRKDAFNQSNPFTITSNFFVLPDAESDSTLQWRPKLWRSDPDVRRKWQQTLKARIGIEEAIEEQCTNAIDTVEGISIVALRDELLRLAASLGLLTGPQNSLLTPARLTWFTRHFQIDAQCASCRKTTRIEQAIETLQGVLQGVRDGLLEDLSLSLNNLVSFDEDWNWIGTYSNWKAAMIVFLYPENTLRPTLRRQHTPGFAKFINGLRMAGAITPNLVGKLVSDYDAYFIDLCNLELKGTCKGTHLGSSLKVTNWNYYLGASKISGKLYFCYTNETDEPSYWYPIDIPDIGNAPLELEAYGMAFYMPGDREQYLYIFIGNKETGAPFGFSRTNLVSATDLGSLRWSLFNELSLPKNATELYDAGVNAGAASSPTELLIALSPSEAYIRSLNVKGTAWSPIDFVEANLPKKWVSLGTFSCTSNAANSSVKPTNMAVGDFDGDGFDEVAIIPEYRAPDYNDIWIMKYTQGSWKHLSPINGASLETDLRCAGNLNFYAWNAVAGDFDGDGRDELIVLPSFAGNGNPIIQFAFWMYHFNANGTWSAPAAVSQANSNRFAYREIQNGYINTDFVKVGDFDGDGIDELAFKVYSPYLNEIKAQSAMWIFKYNAQTKVWDHETFWMDTNKNKLIKDAVVMDFDRDGFDEILALKENQNNTEGNDFWNAQIRDHEWKVNDLELDLAFENVSADYPLAGSFDGINRGVVARQENTDNKYWVSYKSNGLWQNLPTLQGGPVQYYYTLDIDGDLRDEVVEVLSNDKIEVHDWTGKEWKTFAVPGTFGREKFEYSRVSAAKGRFTETGAAEQFLYWVPKNNSNTENTFAFGYVQPDFSAFNPQSPLFSSLKPNLNALNPIYKPNNLQGIQVDVKDWNNKAMAITGSSKPAVKDCLDEMFYFLPMEAGIRLEQERYYEISLDWFRLVLNYVQPPAQRRISFKLRQETGTPGFFKADNWVNDPLQPHLIASLRPPSYTRYTLLCIIRCLLDDADDCFTRATSESLAQALNLYLKAAELLDAAELNLRKSGCADIIGRLTSQVGEDEITWELKKVYQKLNKIKSESLLEKTVSKLKEVLDSQKTQSEKWVESKKIVDEATEVKESKTVGDKIEEDRKFYKEAETFVAMQFNNAGMALKKKFTKDKHPRPWEWEIEEKVIPAPSFSFCIPPNPLINTLKKRIDLNLLKLRTCRNIAGLPLRVDPYVLPSVNSASAFDQLPMPQRNNLRPLPYRYGSLIERAKQLIELARQMEQSMLQYISAAEQEKYQILKARQDLGLAEAAVQLRIIQGALAEQGVVNSQLQIDKTKEQLLHYSQLLSAGISKSEEASLLTLGISAVLKATVGTMYITAGSIPSADSILTFGSANVSNIASGISSLAEASSTTSSIFSSAASFERRRQEWAFNRDQSKADVKSAQAQYATAWTQVRIANQERDISELQTANAQQVLDYLNTGKFLNYDLYEWMSSVIESIYSFFLQQATVMAQLAEIQLGFERQEVLPAFIQSDYWQPVSENQTTASASQTDDKRGLTGSARLLRDVYQLDQYAFRTNKRKLQLSETFSLIQLDPVSFSLFKQTGVLDFDTSMRLFDTKFPGHYLRLIRRVRVSVIALIPPAIGIRASLSNIGSSKVVLGPDSFETVDIRREPESISFTTAISATGFFELDAQPELLIPFEGIGVDTKWQFQMPKAANQFDFDTIADILFTVEYTALSSYDYRQEVIRKLPPEIDAMRLYSFRDTLADAWYDLNNPDLTETPMKVSFNCTLFDFPPNIVAGSLTIAHVALYFVRSDNNEYNPPLQVTLQMAEKNQAGNEVLVGGQATSANGLFSTRIGNASTWNALIGKNPANKWVLTMPNDNATKKLFSDGVIKDVLFVISYSGDLPSWPE